MAVNIWLLRQLDQFNGRLGFRTVSEKEAADLVKKGDAQLVDRSQKLQRPDLGAVLAVSQAEDPDPPFTPDPEPEFEPDPEPEFVPDVSTDESAGEKAPDKARAKAKGAK